MTDRVEVRETKIEVRDPSERRIDIGVGGPAGGIGPPGPPGGSFEHVQSSAAATWIATHNFGRRAVIEVIDATDASVIPEATHTTTAVTIVWATPTTGRVVCM